jgi:thiol-disulfide isomerase/thioredoxin
MHRLLAGACLLALLALVARGDDTKAQKPSEMWAALLKEYQAARSNEERNKLLDDYAKKFIAYGKENTQKESGAEALGLLFRLPATPALKGSRTEAIAILKKDYANTKVIKPVLGSLARTGDEGLKIVQGVYKDNADKATRAYAAKALAKRHEQALRRGTIRNPADRAQAEKEMKEYLDQLRGELKGHTHDLFVGGTAPEIVSQNVKGEKVKLSDLKGKVVVLDIWATWCPPCRAMIPHSRELVEKLKDKPFVLVGISADAKKETLTDFMKKNDMPWTHWWNGATEGIVKDWEVEYYPTIYVLDHKGVIRYKDVRGEEMDKAVETLLKEMEDKTKAKGS